MVFLTRAHSDVAELGLFGRAAAGLSSVLGQLARAGTVAITPTARRRAQAPWRPLVPSTIHYTRATQRDVLIKARPHLVSKSRNRST